MSLLGEGNDSPHADVGPNKFTGYAAGNNVLDVDTDQKIAHSRFAEFKTGEPSAGVAALKKLSTPEEFEQLRNMDRAGLSKYLSEKYPGTDYSKYHDSYELLEALGAQKARAAGYDAIYAPDQNVAKMDPSYRKDLNAPPKDFSEYVALKPDAIRWNRPINGLPEDIQQKIDTNQFSKLPEKYQDTVLTSLKKVAEGKLSDKELAAAKLLSDEQAKNFEIGSANDLLHHQIADYMTRVYKDENPEGKVVLSNAKQGRFATNVSQWPASVYMTPT